MRKSWRVSWSVGAEIESRDAAGNTPLLLASAAGLTGIVKRLLSGDADIEARNMVEMTPLMRAARNGHSNVVAILLKKGADRSALDERDRAQQHAILAGYPKIAKKLAPRPKRNFLKRKRV